MRDISASGAALGAFMFLASLWIAGWAFLWYHAEKSITPIEDRQKLIGMPPGQILLKMKLLSVRALMLLLSSLVACTNDGATC
eukprot:COSAG02_NODE_49_length_45106_cov_298.436177_27_plen_83_part_00